MMETAEFNLIRSIHVRNFRSLANTTASEFGPLNVFIGKNNAGKSTILQSIEKALSHLKTGEVTANWESRRASEEFTDRNSDGIMQIGIEFDLGNSANFNLRQGLSDSTPQLARSIEQLVREGIASFILRFVHDYRGTFQYVESINLGSIDTTGDTLRPGGTILLETPPGAALALFQNKQDIARLNSRVKTLTSFTNDQRGQVQMYFREKTSLPPRYLIDNFVPPNDPARREYSAILESAKSIEDFRSQISALIASAQDEIEHIEAAEIDVPLISYSGEVRRQPQYISVFMKTFGDVPLLHLKETKKPIGQREAEQLLGLKVKRGGPERLRKVQKTVSGLLGVNLDAFQGEETDKNVEMDVDNFLAEANGAGIREALRIILDLELERPKVVLLEEPEVHLHPGLEHAMHGYLQEKSKEMQIFVTTHSTNFVDAVSLQNIYLITRGSDGKSECEHIGIGDAPTKIPAELGLKLSTVFMFDRLIFVEGPSDEAVLREIARTLNIDFAVANIGFVHMGGVKNFTHYAVEGTLDLLARRRIKMWFVIDRDERDEKEISRMIARLGERAHLHVLPRREMENFLIDPKAIQDFTVTKNSQSKLQLPPPTIEQIQAKLDEVALEVKDEVLRLYMSKVLLAPVYMQGGEIDGSFDERIQKAIEDLTERLQKSEALRSSLENQLFSNWTTKTAQQFAPGSLLLSEVCKKLGTSFKKDAGDGARLAKYLTVETIPRELKELITKITALQ